jgi:hypothetical protein
MTDIVPTDSISADIADLSPEAQLRVDTIADMLRGLMQTDASDETELAMLLVLEEINDDFEACEHIGAVSH